MSNIEEKNIFPIKLFNSWTNVMLRYLNSISINWSKSNMSLYFLWLSDLLSRKLNGLWPFFHVASFAYSIGSGQYLVLNDMKLSDIEGKVWSWSDIEWKKSMKWLMDWISQREVPSRMFVLLSMYGFLRNITGSFNLRLKLTEIIENLDFIIGTVNMTFWVYMIH